jgi:glutamine amidotransferase
MSNKPIIIIDYQMGNIRSIVNIIHRIGYQVIVTNDQTQIRTAEKLILPGVGHFQKAIENLYRLNLVDVLNEAVIEKKVPILGICLGMQLMAKFSEEGNIKGLAWIDADVVRFNVSDQILFKVPHIGWNSSIIEKESSLFRNISNESMFYFVHSYHMRCNNKEDILSETEYSYLFPSAIQKGNIFGTQFHPEKSHLIGEQIFKNFSEL